MARLILGFLAAALWLPVLMYVTAGGHGEFWFVMIASFTVPLTLFVAAPLYYFSRRRVTFWACIKVGIALGIVGSLTFLLAIDPHTARIWAPSLLLAGFISSVVFWFVGIWKNGRLTMRSEADAS